MAGYIEYKDSGIPWIGTIPSHWEIQRNKNCFSCAKNIVGLRSSEVQLLSLTTTGIKKKSFDDIGGKVPESYDTYQIVQKNDIVMCLFDLDCSAVFSGLSKYDGMISPAYKVIRCKDTILPGFADYWFRSVFVGRKFKYLAKNIRYSLTYEDFSALTLPLPSLSEQMAIVEYLDAVCADIDQVIAEAKGSIEEYKAWKASIIYEVVTKGLNPDAEMIDSNIEWIGEMPAHWKLIPFRYVLSERNEKNNPVVSTERLSLSIDLGVTLYADKTTNLDRLKEDFTQYKIAHEGDLVMNSMNMIVGASGVSAWFGCVSPAYYTFYDTEEDHVTAKFCEYIFRNKAMLRVLHSMGKGIYSIDRGDDRVNTCRLKVPKDELKSLLIPIPPIEEQRKIVDYLTDKCNTINALVAEKEALLADLESYKKSLIFEVVTGKRKV